MISRREFLKILAAGGASLVVGMGPSALYAQKPPDPPYIKRGRIVYQDRLAAAKSSAQKGLRPAMQVKGRLAASVPPPGGVPDYFGPYPNWALSPLPSLDSGGNVVPGTGVRKFIDKLPGLGYANRNNAGQYIPVAVPQPSPVPGDTADYYEIELGEYTQQLHPDMPAAKFRGYRQVGSGDSTVDTFRYLGPLIVATKDKPVRIKFTNRLPTGSSGNLFIPVDETNMGAGMGPSGVNYTQNRATLHLHGGNTPWISDGTPHQWTAPVGESTPYPKGVSTQNVPDMADPGAGAMTFYYTNQQSARLLFYHDHAYGITRLNVYAGEAAGYLITDPTEQSLITTGVLPDIGIPLVIQDKTFVPDSPQLLAQDPTWDTSKYGGKGSLWFPHVYMPNQNPYDSTGANAMGRWDYGPWFWPPFTGLTNGTVANPYYGPEAPWEPPVIPGTPTPSLVPESFCDTPLVNGAPYPYLEVEQKAYRFRILNACNDRFLNLQIYYAKSNNAMWNGNTLADANAGEVNMVQAIPGTGLPANWPIDGREGGAPDPKAVGPSMIQIGTEGGFLPEPVVIPNQPIGYVYDRRSIVVLNVGNKALFLGPAERADVIVDFSGCPVGSNLIFYNDAPAPVPAFDPRIDYFTGAPDRTAVGGAPPTQPGYGPNTRTVMQFRVKAKAGPVQPYDLVKLQKALPAAYAQAQHPPIVPQAPYNTAFNANYPGDAFARIASTSMSFTPAGGTTPITIDLRPKAIQELFEPEYGRMNSILGVEIPNTSFTTQTTIPYYYLDPPTEIFTPATAGTLVGSLGDGTQIWKITHNGVDTHAIHFHLYDVQLINRVGWDGMIAPPDPNEVGWKDTVRMNPLEDCIVAMRPITQNLPWPLPNSIRPLDVTRAIGSPMGYTNVDPTGRPATVTNHVVNFGYEYVWHCHLLGHEENDMMRSQILAVAPAAPSNVTGAAVANGIRIAWRDNSINETHFTIQRATSSGGPWLAIAQIASTTGPATGGAASYTDTSATKGTPYYYRVTANNIVGDTTPYAAPAVGYPNLSADSAPVNAQQFPISW